MTSPNFPTQSVTRARPLAGKVAVVTGASKGIGAAIARRLAGDGAAVVTSYRTDRAGAQRVVDGIQADGGRARTLHADAGDPGQAALPVTTAVDAFGRLDILVNNAGVFSLTPLDQLDAATVDRHLRVNVTGLLLASQAAVRAFGDDPGLIINLSSTVARRPPIGTSVYSATKGAVDTITRALAKELAPHVRVLAVAPGLVASEGIQAMLGQAALDEVAASAPAGRVGTTEDIANAVALLARDDARWITGVTVTADGGNRL